MQKNDILNTSQLLSVTNAAAFCELSRARFYAIIQKGNGPEREEIDGKPFFNRDVLKAWKRDRKAKKKRKAKA